ncbi:unnamed protein product [[Candida] boidinii]|nr:unnamed protein product [[Candida] boidinii]
MRERTLIGNVEEKKEVDEEEDGEEEEKVNETTDFQEDNEEETHEGQKIDKESTAKSTAISGRSSNAKDKEEPSPIPELASPVVNFTGATETEDSIDRQERN